jgi:hypothetical protein
LFLKLANLFLHAVSVSSTSVTSCSSARPCRSASVFHQRRTGQIFFIFTQRQFGFFLPFVQLGGGLLNTTR